MPQAAVSHPVPDDAEEICGEIDRIFGEVDLLIKGMQERDEGAERRRDRRREQMRELEQMLLDLRRSA